MASGQTIMSALPSSGAYSSHPYRMTAATNAAGPPPPSSTAGRGPTSQALRSGRPTIATSSTAFANIDSTGGVGESPTPVQRFSPLHTSPPATSRISLTNFLTFGGSSRKSRSDSLPSSRQSSRKRRARDRSLTLDPLQSNRATATATTTSDAHRPSRSHSPLSLSQAMERGPRQRTHTLMGTSTAAAKTPSPSHESHPASSFYNRESPLSSHPYAHTFSASRTGPPRRAIVVPPPASLTLDKGKGVDRSHQHPQPSAPDTLSNTHQVPAHLRPSSRTSLFKTISAPNLRNFSRDFSMSKHLPSRGKSRWLSPETWCDALLFPRPRFLEYVDDDPPYSFNDRQPSPIRPPEMTRATKKTPTPLQMTLRGSQSAINLLAPNSGSSRGPPRAEPMLMMRRGSTDADGQSSPGRPLSFAQDDIALPSPVLSLTRVLEMRTSFEHERAEWKAQAARSLQSSKLTRSLGRSRSQSAGRARAQLKDMGGVEFLATKTLLGNQLAAPTVHARTPSDGTHGTQTRSGTSHAHTNSSGGCSASKSRAALRAATGLCVSDGKMSPQVERNDGFSRIDSHGKGVRTETAATGAEVPSTPSPPVTNSSDVGVALSSPLQSPEVDSRVPTKSSYAQDPQSGGGRSQHGRSGSDYAGPHPSAVAIAPPPTAITSDMFARHRLPPHAALHPYAAISAYPNATSSQNSATADPKGSYTAPPEDAPPPWSAPQEPPKSRPQVLDAKETRRMGAHAYASASASGSRVSSGEPLAFADALSYGLRRRGSADSGLGESENHFGGTSAGVATTPLYTPIPNLVLTSMVEHPLDSAPAAPDSAFLPSSRSGHTHTVASSPPELPNPATFNASVLSYSLPSHSGQASLFDESIAAGSGSSSPQRSPRPFSSIEDLDRYRNLFYRPRGSGSSRTPSGEHRRVLSRETTNGGGNGGSTSQDVSSNSQVSGSVGSGLSALARQLNNEWEGSGGLLGSSPPQVWGLRYGGLMGNDGMGSRTDPNAVLSITSDSELNTSSPGGGTTTLPFSLHQSFGLSEGSSLIVPIPQDVESRPTSSMMDRSEMEGEHDDQLLRMGTVEAITTPSATVPPTYRLSFTGDVHGGLSQESLSISRSQSQSQLQVDATTHNDSSASLLEPPPPLPTGMAPRRRSSRSSLLQAGLPSATTEVTRSSYLTDGTGASRISGLSEFPAPPSQTVVPSDRVELLKSYFDDGSGSDASGNVHSRPVSSQIDRPAKASRAEGPVRSRRPSPIGPSRLSESRERAREADHDAS